MAGHTGLDLTLESPEDVIPEHMTTEHKETERLVRSCALDQGNEKDSKGD